jgi:hypothetical protein
MQGSGWLSVLGRIPPPQHNCLVILTTSGMEIMLREIVRMENDFIILRGRMAGSTDDGRAIILPFDQINYLGFNKMMSEAELQAMFGQSDAQSPPAAPTPIEKPPAVAPPPAGTPPPAAAPGGKATAKAAHPSKSLLLARLRARLSGDGSKAP